MAGVVAMGTTVESAETVNMASRPLTTSAFDEMVTDTDNLWIVKFHVPWCQHCQRLAPVWEELSQLQDFPDHTRFGEVNCEEEPDLCERFRIPGYPMVRAFHDGMYHEFRGMRNKEDISSFVLGGYKDGVTREIVSLEETKEQVAKEKAELARLQMDSKIVKIDGDNFDHFVHGEGKSNLVAFYPWGHNDRRTKPILPALWKTSIVLREEESGVDVAGVDCSLSRTVCNRFNFSDDPVFMMFHNEQAHVFEHKLTTDALVKFAQGGYKQVEALSIPEPLTPMTRKYLLAHYLDWATANQAVAGFSAFLVIATMMILVLGTMHYCIELTCPPKRKTIQKKQVAKKAIEKKND